METNTQDIFFHCDECGSILNEADFEFNQKKTHKCANCLVGKGNFAVYLEKKKKSVPFYLFNVFRWLFPYFLWGELLYRMLLSHSFFFQDLLANFSSTGGWVGLAFDIVLMLSGVAAIICTCIVGIKPTIVEAHTDYSTDNSGRIWRRTTFIEHPVLNFFIILWDIIVSIFVCLISFFGIIIFIVIIANQCVKTQKSGMRLSRQEKSQCERYREILEEKNKKCWKYTIFSEAELQRRRGNNCLTPIRENLSVNNEKYFICGSEDIKRDKRTDKIYFLARPYKNQVEYKFLYCTAYLYFGGCRLFIPFHADEDTIDNQKSYFPIPSETILENKKLLTKHYGNGKKA